MLKCSDGAAVAARAGPDTKPGKLDLIAVGAYVVYMSLEDNKHDIFKKLCELGRVFNVSRSESAVVFHKHKPLSSGRLRMKWVPVFTDNGIEVLVTGGSPLLETIAANRLLLPVHATS